MSIKRLYRKHSKDAWTIEIHISSKKRLKECKRYIETFEGTKEEAQIREQCLLERKQLGLLQPRPPNKSGRERLQYLTPHHKSDSAALPSVLRIICAGRGYVVVWQQSRSAIGNGHPPTVRAYKPDLVRALDDQCGPPEQSEKELVVATLIRELERSTGNKWAIPQDVIDWGE